MEYFLELFGDKTVGWAVAVIAAGIFLFACYRKVEKYFSEKAIREKEKDQQVQAVIDQAKQFPQWHQQSIDIREEFNETIRDIGEKIDSVNGSIKDLQRKISESEATTSRYRIIRFDDEIRHEEKHTKEHFDQILEDISAYENYCSSHPDYKNNKAVLAIENIKATYKKCAQEHTFL